jgi:hypothetical protein
VNTVLKNVMAWHDCWFPSFYIPWHSMLYSTVLKFHKPASLDRLIINVNVTTVLTLLNTQHEFFEDFLKAWWVERVSGRWKERDARVAINLCACCREI